MLRPCIDCGTPSRTSPCPSCRTGREHQRGTRQQRGYDAAYEQAKRDPAYLAATHCTTCGQPFTTGNPKTAGHTTDLRTGHSDGRIMPQCRVCNYGWRRTKP